MWKMALGVVGLLGLASGCTTAAPTGSVADQDIVGGVEDQRFQAVGYLSLDGANGSMSVFCTGTLIAPRVVATAAHCLYDTMRMVTPAGPFISFNTGLTTAVPRRRYPGVAVYIAPGYDPNKPGYFENAGYAEDLALMVLESPVTEVAPAEIEIGDATQAYRAVGYGRTVSGPHELPGEALPARKSLPMRIDGGTPETHYRVTPEGGASCYGDSGGPLVADDESGRTRTVGVLASFLDPNPDPERLCAPGTPAAYASFVHHHWLVEQVLATVRAP